MIRIPGSPVRWCDGLSRRGFLQIGGLGAAGLALPDLFRARAHGAKSPTPGAGRAKSCILLFMGGGPPQMDTFDLKPDAPAEVRGEFPPTSTSVPGTQISSLLPALAERAHRYAIIRTVSDEYTSGAHGQSVYLALTGHKNPRVNGDDIPPAANDYPCMGSAVARLRAAGDALRNVTNSGRGRSCLINASTASTSRRPCRAWPTTVRCRTGAGLPRPYCRRGRYSARSARPASTSARFKGKPPGVWELTLSKRLTQLAKGKLTVSVKDRQGNLTHIERTFAVVPPP